MAVIECIEFHTYIVVNPNCLYRLRSLAQRYLHTHTHTHTRRESRSMLLIHELTVNNNNLQSADAELIHLQDQFQGLRTLGVRTGRPNHQSAAAGRLAGLLDR